MPLSAPGTRPTLLLTFASTGGYPSPISVGKVISVPEPTTVLMVPAATPAPKMAKAWATGMLTGQRYPPSPRRPAPRQRDHHDTAHWPTPPAEVAHGSTRRLTAGSVSMILGSRHEATAGATTGRIATSDRKRRTSS